MQTLISFLVSSLIFVGIYQFIAPKFSQGGVAFQPVSFWHKLAFGASMHVLVSIVLFAGAMLSAATVIPATILLVGSSPSLVWVLPAIMLVLLFGVLQASFWLTTLGLGKLMPSIVKVESSRAAFRSAWAPTLIFGLIYGVLLFVVMAFGAAMSLAS